MVGGQIGILYRIMHSITIAPNALLLQASLYGSGCMHDAGLCLLILNLLPFRTSSRLSSKALSGPYMTTPSLNFSVCVYMYTSS